CRSVGFLRRSAMDSPTRYDRRHFVGMLAGVGAAAAVSGVNGPVRAFAAAPSAELASAESASRLLVQYPEKAPLILLTDRPPQLETPLHYFDFDLTPNEAFFVRWHLAGIPTTVDTRSFRLAVTGRVNKPLSLSLHDLETKFEAVSVVALCQCAGNGRSLFEPPVPGGQWGL